jgi:hypothetical protein
VTPRAKENLLCVAADTTTQNQPCSAMGSCLSDTLISYSIRQSRVLRWRELAVARTAHTRSMHFLNPAQYLIQGFVPYYQLRVRTCNAKGNWFYIMHWYPVKHSIVGNTGTNNPWTVWQPHIVSIVVSHELGMRSPQATPASCSLNVPKGRRCPHHAWLDLVRLGGSNSGW